MSRGLNSSAEFQNAFRKTMDLDLKVGREKKHVPHSPQVNFSPAFCHCFNACLAWPCPESLPRGCPFCFFFFCLLTWRSPHHPLLAISLWPFGQVHSEKSCCPKKPGRPSHVLSRHSCYPPVSSQCCAANNTKWVPCFACVRQVQAQLPSACGWPSRKNKDKSIWIASPITDYYYFTLF